MNEVCTTPTPDTSTLAIRSKTLEACDEPARVEVAVKRHGYSAPQAPHAELLETITVRARLLPDADDDTPQAWVSGWVSMHEDELDEVGALDRAILTLQMARDAFAAVNRG